MKDEGSKRRDRAQTQAAIPALRESGWSVPSRPDGHRVRGSRPHRPPSQGGPQGGKGPVNATKASGDRLSPTPPPTSRDLRPARVENTRHHAKYVRRRDQGADGRPYPQSPARDGGRPYPKQYPWPEVVPSNSSLILHSSSFGPAPTGPTCGGSLPDPPFFSIPHS
jgi:hypothetical protein